MNNILENLTNEFVEQFVATHGGNYTKEEIAKAFKDGFKNITKAPARYHAFLAWQTGRKNGGWA